MNTNEYIKLILPNGVKKIVSASYHEDALSFTTPDNRVFVLLGGYI